MAFNITLQVRVTCGLLAERRSWSWSFWDLSRSDVLCFVPSPQAQISSAWLLCMYKVDSEKLTHTVLYV